MAQMRPQQNYYNIEKIISKIITTFGTKFFYHFHFVDRFRGESIFKVNSSVSEYTKRVLQTTGCTHSPNTWHRIPDTD